MKSLVCLLLACTLSLGCDRDKNKPAGGGPPKFRVAMILPGSEVDGGWNQMAREGLDRIAKELGADTRLATHVKTSDFANQVAYFAGEGYDLVVCHGFEFEKAVAEAAPKHPRTAFVVGGYPQEIPGAASVEFLMREPSELAGVLAANVTRKKVVAFVGAMPVPTVKACSDGLDAGVRSSGVAGVRVLEPQWTQNWDAPQLAREKAEAVLGAGADVVYQNVDAAAKGVFEAVRAASRPDAPAFAIGCNRDQNALAPDVIVGSVVIDVPRAYFELAREARDAKAAGPAKRPTGLRRLGLKGGYVDLVLNDAHPAVTPAVRQAVEAARKARNE